MNATRFLFANAKATFLRFPEVLLAATTALILAISLTEHYESHPRLIFSVCLGIPLFLTMTLFRESRGWTQAKYQVAELGLGIGFIAFHYLFTRDDLTDNYGLRYFQLTLALHLCVSFSAFTDRKFRGGFWPFNKALFLRILYSALYASVFYLGLIIALFTLEKLFSIPIAHERYPELWFIAVFVLQTWHFLAGVPKDLSALQYDKNYPKGLRIFVQYLLIPLVTLYMVILYCYMAKIVITWNWPSGYVGWLVSTMSVLGIFNLLIIDPEKDKADSHWIRTYARAYYILILPLIAMLFVAVTERISVYGITEARYFLLALGLLLAALSSYFLLSRNKNIMVVPISLVMLAVFTLVGPWNAYSVSKNSQFQRAKKILERNGMLVHGVARRSQASVSEDDERQLSDIFQYLADKHGIETVEPLTPPNVDGAIAKSFTDANLSPVASHLNKLGLELVHGQQISIGFAYSNENETFDVTGYDGVIRLLDRSPQTVVWNGKSFTVARDAKDGNLWITQRTRPKLSVPLNKMVIQARETSGKLDGTIEKNILSAENEDDSLKVRVFVYSIFGKMHESGPAIEGMTGLLLFKFK